MPGVQGRRDSDRWVGCQRPPVGGPSGNWQLHNCTTGLANVRCVPRLLRPAPPKRRPALRLSAGAVETLGQDRTFSDILGPAPLVTLLAARRLPLAARLASRPLLIEPLGQSGKFWEPAGPRPPAMLAKL